MITKNVLCMLLVLFMFQITSAVEIVFMFDESASVGGRNFRNLKALVQQTAEQIDARLGDNATYSIMEFGHRIHPHKFWDNKAKFYDHLRTMTASNSGATKMSSAFRATADRLFDHNKTTPRVLVMMTDGVPRPGPEFGGPEMVKQAHRCFNESGVDKLIYVHLDGTYGSRPANPNVFNKVGPPYNQSSDMMEVPFKRPSTTLEVDELRIKIIGADSTSFPTASPTWAPTPTESPTGSPSASPTGSPTSDVAPIPLPPDDDQTCFKSDNMGWIIAGSIILAILVFLAGYILGGMLTESRYEKAMRMQDERAADRPPAQDATDQ